MRLTQIVQPACVRVPIQSRDKNAAISELIELLDASGLLLDKAAVSKAVFTRERTRSTGIGSGIAIPHGKCDAVNELVMAIGIAHDPLEFESIDGSPVHIIILLVSPSGETGRHIQALATISRLMLDEQFKQSLERSSHADQAYQLLQEKEQENEKPA